ncbi:MAG: tyrosine-type recombinase/integrase [Bacillota bacterium]
MRTKEDYPTKKNYTFQSIFSQLIEGYIEEKRAVGYKFTKAPSLLKTFDKMVTEEGWEELSLSKNLVQKWTAKTPTETERNRAHRISAIRGLAQYMARLNYPAYIYPSGAISIDRYSYIPYIFSESELKNIFAVCDLYPYTDASPNRHLMLPILFRILYGCGLRISEALKLRLGDIDLKESTLLIRETKFGKQRIVPMAGSVTERCRKYMGQVHGIRRGDNPFLFPSPLGGRYGVDTIYSLFRNIIWKAGISHSGKGPRVHDFRHTFAVHCLKNWVLAKEDVTNLLPYLSVYLGHVDLRGTQHYLRLTADLYPDIVASVEQNFSMLIPEVSQNEAD